MALNLSREKMGTFAVCLAISGETFGLDLFSGFTPGFLLLISSLVSGSFVITT